MKNPKLVYAAKDIDGQCSVILRQKSRDNFTVEYGESIKPNLDYGQAAYEFGRSVMHALACAGKLDNREKGER